MARLSKCKGCEKLLQPDEKYSYKSKTYCKLCYEDISKESNEYKDLVEFICQHYNIDKPTGFMFKQIKELKTEYLYTYASMTYTLWYCKEILNKQLSPKYGLSLIKYYYDDAKDYYLQQEKREKKVDEVSHLEIKTKVIKKSNKSPVQNNSLINIENLIESGDNN